MEEEGRSLLALARSEWEKGRRKSAGRAQWAFILSGQAVQAIKLSAKRGHY